ncbi:MAG TPA: metalloregulator ArsR/SmtB family transcription factor [Rhizomicrobium sp.]|jgi:DNA-binding transcriptional ArsR family regulator|nr:metalloregulator ArsR/SmtB family transcription factor [Rhizomicrobium sp.]
MSDVFDALAHPTRRKIVGLLRRQAMSAGDIADKLDIAKPTLSRHLSVMKAADLVDLERQGTSLIYRLNVSVVEETLVALMNLAGVKGRLAAEEK